MCDYHRALQTTCARLNRGPGISAIHFLTTQRLSYPDTPVPMDLPDILAFPSRLAVTDSARRLDAFSVLASRGPSEAINRHPRCQRTRIMSGRSNPIFGHETVA